MVNNVNIICESGDIQITDRVGDLIFTGVPSNYRQTTISLN